jgi:hypothetical protein
VGIAIVAPAVLPARAAPEGAPPETPGYAGKSVEWWIGELVDGRTLEIARRAIVASGPTGAGAIVRALAHPSPLVRREAASLLPGYPLSPALAADVSRALERFDGGDDRPSAAALLRALGSASPLEHPSVEVLARFVEHSDPQIRLQAIALAGKRGSAAASLAPAVAESLSSGDASIAQAAASALERMGPPPSAAPALSEAARGRDPGTRVVALRSLARLAPVEPSVLAVLLAARSDPEASVFQAAYDALAVVAKTSAPPTSVEAREGIAWALGEPEPMHRLFGLRALGTLGSAAAPHVAEIARLVDDADPSTVEAATRTLQALGEAARPALPALVRLGVRSPEVAAPVLRSLAANGAPDVLALLDDDVDRRGVVLDALAHAPVDAFLERPEDVLARLLPLVGRDGVPRAQRRAAVRVLVRLGAASPDVEDRVVARLRSLVDVPAVPGSASGDAWILSEALDLDASHFPPTHREAREFLVATVLDGVVDDPGPSRERALEAVRVLGVRVRRGSEPARHALARIARGEGEVAALARELSAAGGARPR